MNDLRLNDNGGFQQQHTNMQIVWDEIHNLKEEVKRLTNVIKLLEEFKNNEI